MSKPRLYFTMGASHSGKSTFAKKWQKEQSDNPRVVVTTDNIRIALNGQRYNKDAETVVFANKHIMIKTLLLEGYDVLACGTHTTKESIKRILEIDPDAIPIVFDVEERICLERTKLTKQNDMNKVISRHCQNLKKLLDQGIDNVLNEVRNEIEIRWNKN